MLNLIATFLVMTIPMQNPIQNEVSMPVVCKTMEAPVHTLAIEANTLSKKEIKKILIRELGEEGLHDLVMVVVAEADGESVKGKRLVIDTVLNRTETEGFHNTISEVVWAPNQFTGMNEDRLSRCTYDEKVERLIYEELVNRTNYEVLYFRTEKYSNYGEPLFKEGGHYFSGNKLDAES